MRELTEEQTLQAIIEALRLEAEDEVILKFALRLQPTNDQLHIAIIALTAMMADELEVAAQALQILRLENDELYSSLVAITPASYEYTLAGLVDIKLQDISEDYKEIRELPEEQQTLW